jgi:type IV pilus assembly protein PilF
VSRLARSAPLLAALLAAGLAGCISSSSGGRDVDNAAAADSNVKLGVAYMNEGRMELAKEKLDRAGKQDPKSADVQFALAELYSRLEQPKDADRHYRAAIELAPDKLEIVNGYAVFLCTNQEVDRGIAQFEKLMHNPLYGRQAAAATNAGMCLRDQKRHAESVRFFETALAKQPDWLEAVVQLADVQIVLEKPEAARAAVDKYQSMRNSATALVMGVRAAVKEGNCNAARTYSIKLRKDFPNSRETLQLLPQVIGACSETARP